MWVRFLDSKTYLKKKKKKKTKKHLKRWICLVYLYPFITWLWRKSPHPPLDLLAAQQRARFKNAPVSNGPRLHVTKLLSINMRILMRIHHYRLVCVFATYSWSFLALMPLNRSTHDMVICLHISKTVMAAIICFSHLDPSCTQKLVSTQCRRTGSLWLTRVIEQDGKK